MSVVQPPSVLLVCITTVFGGAEVRVMQTARALEAAGWPYRVAVLPDSPLHERLRSEGLATEPMGKSRADPRILPALIRAARRIRADVIDSHNMQSQYWASLAAGFLPGIRRIVTVHSVYRECYPKPPKTQIHEGALRLGRLVGSKYLAVSETVAADLERIGVRKDRITVSENGIEALAAPPVPSTLFETLGWPEDAFVISIVGRLEPVKGHTFLFQALAGLVRSGAERVRVLVVGDGRDREELEAEVASLDIGDFVHFAGFRSDIPDLLARTDLLCMPSLTEGLPYTALEAGRQAVPLLLSRVGGPERIFTEGETAAFVPPSDAKALETGIAALLDDPEKRRRLGAAAQDLVARRFSVDRMNAETLAHYAAGVGGGHA